KDLRESEEKFRTLAEKSPNIIFINKNGRVVYVNERAAEVLGYPRDHFLSAGFELSSIIAPESWPAVQVNLQRHARNENVAPYEYMILGNEGRRIDAISTTRLITYEGSPAILGIITDITEKKKIESELIRANKLDSIGVLAGGIAHDFNNILTGIISNMFMAKINLKNDPETSLLLHEAEKAAFRASKLTKQLLTFAKGGAPVKEVASLKEIIQDAVGFCLSGSRVDYKLSLPDDLEAVEIDKGQIDQVLNNLIINADQAMEGGGTLAVSACNVTVESNTPLPLKGGRYVKVSIKDTGKGIPPEAAARIFDPYFTTKKSGSGLGLTTAYSIIKKHNGHIGYESQPGAGTTFSFYLPVSNAGAPAENENATFPAPSRSGCVLIMDDDEIVRTIMERLLKAAGYATHPVAHGAAALAAYKEAAAGGAPFLAVIMDLTIQGGMGGAETAAKIIELDAAAKLIVVSGYSTDPVLSHYRDYGFSGAVTKPFTTEEFIGIVKRVINGQV
ncbi:MAG: ATP-binding protein, partial [Chitinivibrionales bacterium]|nr:ATP-binding protein [Chitinivibrionales bacterium]